MEKSPLSLELLSRVKEIKFFSDEYDETEEMNELLKKGWVLIAITKWVYDTGSERNSFYLARLNDASPLQKQ